MALPDKEIRPEAIEADSKKFTCGRTVPSLVDLTPDQLDIAVVFYQSGYMHGLDAGRRHERDETTALMREAVRIVHALSNVPPRDVEADQRQAEKRAAYWAERRGEVA